MKLYCELSIPIRSLIILGLFLAMCMAGYFLFLIGNRKKQLSKIGLLWIILLCGIMMVIYTAQARAELLNLEMTAISGWLCEQSCIFPVSLLLLSVMFFGYLTVEEMKFRKSTITQSSIKEGIDKISTGLCVFMEGGRVILVNSRMNELCHQMIGGDLQNAETFWQFLCSGEVKSEINRISYGNYPVLRLPDGTVWTFSREELEGFIQLTATDTTLLQTLTEELRDKNLELAALNLRLRRYSKNVDELARTKERLETKVRIHGELGQALLTTRHYLVDSSVQEPPLDVWKRNIAMLRKELETKKTEEPLHILQKAAASAGVKLEIRGELSAESEYRQFFLVAASEALTNAVVHAGAGVLKIDLSESETQWCMRFSNDGRKPETTVTEGGGLGSIRRKAESMGAVMVMESCPEFALVITGHKGEL